MRKDNGGGDDKYCSYFSLSAAPPAGGGDGVVVSMANHLFESQFVKHSCSGSSRACLFLWRESQYWCEELWH